MSKFYCITPIHGGKEILIGLSNFNHIVEVPKDYTETNFQPMYFGDPETAQAFIVAHLNEKEYKIICIERNKDFSCPYCGSDLKTKVSFSSDETISGFAESLCTCVNNRCAINWNVVRDNDGKIKKIERYYFG